MQLRDTIQHYAWVIRYRALLIFFGTIICATATFVTSIYLPPVYQASTLLIVNEVTTASSNDVFSNQALALSYSLLITRDDVLHAVAQKLPEVNIAQLKSAVSDAPVANTQIIEIRAQAVTPRLAADIANVVATVFIQLQASRETTDLQHVVDQLTVQIAAAKTNVDAAQTQLNALLAAHASTESITQQHNILDGYQGNYNTLVTNYHQIQQRQLQTFNALSIAQLATPPERPISPQVTLNTSIAGLMGLLLMVVLALLFDWLDATIKTPEDVAQLALLEPLGSLPLVTPSDADPSLLNSPAIEEAFVSIGTNFRALSKGRRLILITTVRAGSGTSTTAAHLAIALAQTGLRVLLVDANLRHPTLHEVFHGSNTRGLLNNLVDVQMLRDQPMGLLWAWLKQWCTRVPNLWLLPVGSPLAHTPAILRASELRQLCMYLLGQHYTGNEPGRAAMLDMIIFDAPSLDEGSDTLALASITGATALVVEAGREQKEALIKAQKTLQRAGSPILGVVVNRQRTNQHTYFYANYDQMPVTYREKAQIKALQEEADPYTADLLPETPAQLSIVPEALPTPAIAEEKQAGPAIPGTFIEEVEKEQEDLPMQANPLKPIGRGLPGLKALSPDKSQHSGLRNYYNHPAGEQSNEI